jgi:hypothetical protein
MFDSIEYRGETQEKNVALAVRARLRWPETMTW